MCKTADVTKCDWTTALNGFGYHGVRFDSINPFPVDCGRWFTDHHYDHGSPDSCFESIKGVHRCFAKGRPCVGEIRDHVAMYKWSLKEMKVSGNDVSQLFIVRLSTL